MPIGYGAQVRKRVFLLESHHIFFETHHMACSFWQRAHNYDNYFVRYHNSTNLHFDKNLRPAPSQKARCHPILKGLLSRPKYPNYVVQCRGPWCICGSNEPNQQLGLAILERTQVVTYGVKMDPDTTPLNIWIFVGNKPELFGGGWARVESFVCDPGLIRTSFL